MQLLAKFVVSFGVLLTLFTPSVRASERPEEVAQRYFSELERIGVNATPKFLHPDDLVRFREFLLPVMTGSTERSVEIRRSVFGQDSTPESVLQMAPLPFMQKYVGAIYWRMASAEVRYGPSLVLGTVSEGSVVHLLARANTTVGQSKISEVKLFSFKRFEGKWMLLLPSDIEGIAQALRGKEN